MDFDSSFTPDGKINYAARANIPRDQDPILTAKYQVENIPPPREVDPPDDVEDDIDEW